MKSKLLGGICLIAGVGLLGVSQAAAGVVPVPPPASDFSISETPGSPGSYTVFDNSTDWFVWGFSITYAPGANGPFTTQTDWTASTYSNTFSYSNTNGAYSDLIHDIAPGGSSSNFFFYSAFAASQWDILVTNGITSYDVPGPAATPLPAALPLMATVLGAGYLISRRRRPRGPDPLTHT
jgi:hypothetical protein